MKHKNIFSKIFQYPLSVIILGSMSFSIGNTQASFSCMQHDFSQTEEEIIQNTLASIDEFMYQTRRDVPTLTHNLRQKIIYSDMQAEKKCLYEKIFLDYTKQVQFTHHSHKNISEYMMHYYYKHQYLPNIPESTLENYIFQKGNHNNEVYLTFDDGPYNSNIVNFLKNNDIAATFFLMCSRMNSQNMQAYKTPLFSLGGHTMYHDNYDTLSEKQVLADISACSKVFQNLDIQHRIYRPAYGIINDTETKGLVKNNLTAYVWNIDSADWAGDFSYDKAQEILNHVQSGDILLFHEGVDLEVFEFLIKGLKEKGFNFGKL